MGRKPCCERVGLKRGRWTEEEDAKLIKYIEENGEGSWRSLPGNASMAMAARLLRCGKSCRLRWTNYLRPNLEKGRFSSEEDDLIIWLHASFGCKWSLIARHLPGRTDNRIKNYWNSHLRRKIHPFWRRKIANGYQSFPINDAKLNLPPNRLSWKEEKTHIQKFGFQTQNCNVDSCSVNYVVPASTTTEVIAMADVVVSNPEARNNEENTEQAQETAVREKEGEAKEGSAGSGSNVVVACKTTNIVAERDETSHGPGGSEERESGGLSFLGMAEKWDRYSSETCREEDKILSWLWDDDDDDDEWGRTNKEVDFDPEKQDAMFAWLLS